MTPATGGLRLGIVLPQQLIAWDELLETALLVEEAGFDSLWAVDHYLPVVARTMAGSQFDAWTVLAAWAQATKRVRLGTAVTCNGFRPPALLAKAVTTVDHISHGRAVLGLGAGWFEAEHRVFGWDFPSIGERLDRLAESVRVLKACWTEERPVFHGTYYRLDFGAPAGSWPDGVEIAPKAAPAAGPRPVQQPHPTLSIGGTGRRKTLRIVAEHADDWNAGLSPAGFRELGEVLAGYCHEIGRDPATISRSTVLGIVLEDSPAAVAKGLEERAWRYATDVDLIRDRTLTGDGSAILEQLAAFAAAGVSEVQLLVDRESRQTTVERIAKEVLEPLRHRAAPVTTQPAKRRQP